METTEYRDMQLATTFGRRAVYAFIVLLVLFVALIVGVLFAITGEQDTRSVEQSRRLAVLALSSREERLRGTTKDYAAWGEAYAHLHPTVDAQWAWANANLYEHLQIDDVFVIDPAGNTAYAVIEGKLSSSTATERFGPDARALIMHAADVEPGETRTFTTFVRFDGRLFLVAAAAISPGDDPQAVLSPGKVSVLVLAVSLTRDRLVEIARRYYLPELRFAAASAPAPEIWAPTYGEPLALTWNPSLSGQGIRRMALWWLAVAVVVFGLLGLAFRKLLLAAAGRIDRQQRELVSARAEAMQLATHDLVTGLPNHLMLRDHVGKLVAAPVRGPIALMVFDLDRFKPINEALGHAAGDRILAEVGRRLTACGGPNVFVARIRSDQFIAVSRIRIEGEGAEDLCRRLIAAIGEPFAIVGSDASVGATAGIALFPSHGDTMEELLRKAKFALREGKTISRGHAYLFSSAMNQAAFKRLRMKADLQGPLLAGQFFVQFQPRFSTASLALLSVEALVRWRHPVWGLVPPDMFIPLAEESGLIVPLGEWVLRTACRAVAPLHGISVSVNISSAQIRGLRLPDIVREALSATGLEPERLELEVTENVLLQEVEHAGETLAELKAIGVSLAIDDFGKGYSSLSHLRGFPFDRIKIDRSFISELAESEEAQAIVRSVVDLGKALGMSTTAEGVETIEQLIAVQQQKCDEVQGYLLARPMDIEQLQKLLRANPTLVA